jgi:hypothetical protein
LKITQDGYGKLNKPHQYRVCAFLIGLSLFVYLCLVDRVFAQSETGWTPGRVEKIGVAPFLKGRNLANERETLRCPLFQLYFNPENLSASADRILSEHVHEVLKTRFGEKVIPISRMYEVHEGIPKEQYTETPRTLAQKTGSALGANLVIFGSVWRFRERVGGALGVESPASVAFAVGLVDVSTGKLLWNAHFDKTQRALTEDIRDIKGFLTRGGKWLTADQLARYGVNEIFKKFPF